MMLSQIIGRRRWLALLASGLGMCIAAPAMAGHDDDWDNDASARDRSSVYDDDDWDDDDWDDDWDDDYARRPAARLSERFDRFSSGEGSSERPGATYTRLNVSGDTKVRVGYDTDGDGTIDSYACVRAADLEQALSGADFGERRAALRRGLQMLRGRITNIETARLEGFDQPHLIVRLEGDRGTMTVALGPQRRLARLNLKNGDQLIVYGKPARFGGRQMFRADRLVTDGLLIGLGRAMGLQRFNGEILQTRTEQINNREHLIATVRLDSGRTVTADLGPRERIRDVNLSSGKNIEFTANRGDISGTSGLIVNRFKFDGRMYRVQDEEGMRLRGQPVSPQQDQPGFDEGKPESEQDKPGKSDMDKPDAQEWSGQQDADRDLEQYGATQPSNR